MDKKEWQKLKNIKSLLEHKGWKEYEAKIQEKIEYHQTQIDLICAKTVRADELESLNDQLTRRNMLQQILNIKQELIEDIENSSESTDVNETQLASIGD